MNNEAEQLTEFGTGLALVLFVLGLISWSTAIYRLATRQSLIPFEARRPVPWEGAWALVAVSSFIGVVLVVSTMVAGVHIAQMPPAERALAMKNPETALMASPGFMLRVLQADCASKLLTISLVAAALMLFKRAVASDLGISLSRLPLRILQGGFVFFLVAPATMLLQYVMVEIVGIKYDHPVIETLKDVKNGQLVYWCALAVVVVAPLVEEFVFRGVLQGWLERAFADHRTPADFLDDHDVADDALELTDESDLEPPPLTLRHSVIPILISSTLFAAVHIPQWAALVPLFVFALGLGYLYRQTHSIWPPVVMHFMLNALSLTMLLFGQK